MSASNAEKNKATMLKGFETLFNMRDYMAAERFWSIQSCEPGLANNPCEPARTR